MENLGFDPSTFFSPAAGHTTTRCLAPTSSLASRLALPARPPAHSPPLAPAHSRLNGSQEIK
eukprot:scaffold69108_cov51-Phaeocystis_antarctica.AAC.3